MNEQVKDWAHSKLERSLANLNCHSLRKPEPEGAVERKLFIPLGLQMRSETQTEAALPEAY